jgi:hypothetical protein
MVSTNDALRRADVPEMRCETAQRPSDTSRRKILVGGAGIVAALGLFDALTWRSIKPCERFSSAKQ